MKKINTLNSVIQTTEGRKNLGITKSMLPRSFAPLWMTVMMVLAFTACSEEDLVQPTNGEAGSLRIASVIIDGQEVGRSRMAYEGSVTHDYHYNRSITGFTDGDKLTLDVGFTGTNRSTTSGKAVYGNGTWSIEKQFRPDPTKNNEYWKGVYIRAAISCVAAGGKSDTERDKYQQVAQTMGIVQGDIPVYAKKVDVKEYHYSLMVGDALAASTYSFEQTYNGYGSITVDTDLNSPTLGAATIVLKHTDRALLRLPKTPDAFRVTPGDYIVNGKCINLTSLASLWAVFYDSYPDDDEYRDYQYIPFTEVTIGGQDYLQAIVSPGGIDFVGFKAVMCTKESGKVGSEGFDGSKTHTLDLPFKVGGAASNKYRFASNTQYPMTLNISPNSAAVTFTTPEGKPGWALDVTETELSNANNEFDLKYIAGEGGAAGTFMVKTAQGLQDLNKWMTGNMTTAEFKGKITCDPANYDFNIEKGSTDAKKQNITLAANITLPTVSNGESNWIPIQNYQGIFNGSNKTIRNLTIVNGTLSNIGLIGCLLSEGKVKDVNLENVLIDSRSRVNPPYNKIGGIVGYSYADTDDDAEVSGCTVSGKIWGGFSCVGGIVGCTENDNFIRDCTLVAGSELDAKDFTVGGIVGAMGTNCKVYNCNVSAKIGSYESETAGGIVGRVGNGTLIEKCETAEGSEVKGYMRVAGILADSSSTNTCKVIDCINRSNVRLDMKTSYEEYIGGIVADGNNIDITNCTNYGALTSDDAVYMGGIIGKGPSCKLENCTNMETATLTVTSKTPDQYTRLGGIIGYARYLVQVKGCMNHAAITHTYNSSQNYIGGIVGEMYNYDNGDGFVACGNTGSITLQKMDGITSSSSLYVGGIAGYNYDTDCKYRGCWTKDVVEHNGSMTVETTEKDGFGFVYSTNSASSIINSYTASAKTEGTTDQAFINGKVDEMNDDIRSYGWQWVVDTNGDWPTLTTTAPALPTQGN